MDPNNRPRIWFIGGVVITLVGIIVGTLVFVSQPKDTLVPDVVGSSSTQAEEMLAKAGLKVGETVESTVAAAPDTVISQDPGAGETLQTGSEVTLEVAGASSSGIPNVVGMAVAKAESALDAAGYEGQPFEVEDPTAEANTVFAQMPNPGTGAPKGAPVLYAYSSTLPSSEPGAPSAVPDVVGQKPRQADAAISQAGFAAIIVEIEAYDAKPGIVFQQFPDGDVRLPPGSFVLLGVAADE